MAFKTSDHQAPILVIGATGTHGGAVARRLLASRHTVYALVRDPRSDRAQALARSGATLISGDLQDVGSLVRAFDGVAAVYAVTTPFERGAEEEEQQGENIIAAAQTADLGWLLLASVAAAGRAQCLTSRARRESSGAYGRQRCRGR